MNFNTRKLCKDLCKILNLPMRTTFGFVKILSKALIHKVAEEALDKEDGKLKKSSIEIPCICRLDIEISGNNIKLNNIEFDEDFKSDVLKAVNTGDSPLITDAEKALIESFKNRYNSII